MSFSMSRHTLPNSVSSFEALIKRSKKHIGDKREDGGGKGNAFDEENE